MTYEVDIGCQITSKSDRAHLGSICDCQGLEDAPWDAGKNVTDEENLNTLSSEENRRESSDESQTGEDGPAIANPFRDISVDEEADDLTDL